MARLLRFDGRSDHCLPLELPKAGSSLILTKYYFYVNIA